MTLVAPRTETAVAPATRAVRLAALAVPGAVLGLCTAAAVSLGAAHLEIAQAVQALLAAH